jgi:membrane-bound lytic murein transglycosylase D
VKAGETLASIAGRYQVGVDDLRRWNKVGRLLAGQSLTIHARAETGGPRAVSKGRPVVKPAKGKLRQISKKKNIKKPR